MPYIKEDDLAKLYSEVDKLKEDKSELQDGFIKLKKENNKLSKQQRSYKIAAIVLLLLTIGALLLWYFSYQKTNTYIKKHKEHALQLDSIQNLTQEKKAPSINSDQLIYLVQIGNYTNIDLFNSTKAVSNFQQIQQPQYNTYLMGGFATYEEATKFKDSIQKLGIKDAFLVAYKNQQAQHR